MISHRHLRILRQYAVVEWPLVGGATRLRRWLSRLVFYVESKQVFDFALDHGFLLTRDGATNILEFGDEEIGQCRVTLRRRTSDFAVFSQCFCSKQYRPLVAVARHCLGKDAVHTVVDAGANIGLSALYLARSFPGARVVCIEPDEGNYRQCRSNLDANGLGHVTSVRAALWTEETPVALFRGFRDGREWALRVAPLGTGQTAKVVEGIRLGVLLKRHNFGDVDLLKMDVEGAEKALFDERVGDFRNWLPRTRLLAIESHDKEVLSRILSLLQGNGFFAFSSGELTLAVKENLVDSARMLQFFRQRVPIA